jgi:hypothetical protein
MAVAVIRPEVGNAGNPNIAVISIVNPVSIRT